MGEAKKRAKHAIVKRMEPMIVDTPGGRIHVQWDSDSSATPNGQLTFFAEFLHTSGIYDAWVQDCPLHYTSPNAPTKYDVLVWGSVRIGTVSGNQRKLWKPHEHWL